MAEARVDSELEIDLRILLVGKTGHGKSATGNSILGETKFLEKESCQSVTRKCQRAKVQKHDKTIEIVDAPGFFDTKLSDQDIELELTRALLMSAPGFHCVCFVLKMERFSPDMVHLVETFFNFFGPEASKFACIIFTHAEKESQLKRYFEVEVSDPNAVCASSDLKQQLRCESIGQDLYDFVMRCEGNILIIDNKPGNKNKAKQVEAILAEVERIKRNGHGYYTNKKFQLASTIIQTADPDKLRTSIEDVEKERKEWLNKEYAHVAEKKLYSRRKVERYFKSTDTPSTKVHGSSEEFDKESAEQSKGENKAFTMDVCKREKFMENIEHDAYVNKVAGLLGFMLEKAIKIGIDYFFQKILENLSK